MKQVITISPTGGITSLDHKKKGIDLRKMGKVSIKRVTIIQWDETRQKWFIKWEDSGKVWDSKFVQNVMFNEFDPSARKDEITNGNSSYTIYYLTDKVSVNGVAFFDDYEDAVSVEIAVYQILQQNQNKTR